MKDVALIIGIVTMYIAVFGMAAWLIYEGVNGWGWFLFCAVLILGNMHWKID